ncbi:MAG TPA: thrombospondin type 3 repeat-containing protein [Thermoleophilaceae bacterium]|nr:thrombospondin type 3 repeat-containing protein [Thermoleophilaceae bacterium]
MAACLLGLILPATAVGAPPSNDNQANATVLPSSLPVSATGTNVQATAEAGEQGHYFTGDPSTAVEPIASVWWKWTVPSTGTYTFDTCDSTFDVAFAMYRDDGTPTDSSRFNNDTCDRQERLSWFWAGGTQLLFAIDGVGGETGTVDLEITKADPPTNDNFAQARTLTGPVDSDGSPTASATAETNEPQHAGQPAHASVWWKWVAPNSGNYVIDACQPGAWAAFYSTRVAIYTQAGSGLGGLALVDEDRLSAVCGDSSRNGVVPIAAVAGTTYYIAVDGRLAIGQNAFVNVRPQVAPPNDDFADAEAFTTPNAFDTVDNRDATAELNEPEHVFQADPNVTRSVWWRLAMPATVDVHIRVSADHPAGFAFYEQTGSGLAGLNLLERESLYASVGSRDHAEDYYVRLEAGTTYYLAVDGNGDPGNDREAPGGNITVEVTPIPVPANDDFADAEPFTGTEDSAPFTTRGASVEASEPGTAATGRSVWFKWTAPSAARAVLDACGFEDEDGFDVEVDFDVFEQNGSGFAGLAVAPPADDRDCRGDDFGGGGMRYPFAAAAGKTYYIQVQSTTNNADYVDLEARFRILSQPVNDNLADARTLTGATDSDTGTSTDATHQPMEPTDNTNGPGSVWWKWTAPAVARYVIDTCGSNFDTELRPYRSDNPNPAVNQLVSVNTPVIASPDCGSGSRWILDNGTAGRTYYIAVDGLSFTSFGDVEISVRPFAPPANDDLANAAQLVGLGAEGSVSTIEATVQEDEPRHVATTALQARTVWWKWTAPSTQDVLIDGCATRFDTVMGIYTASGGGTFAELTQVASNKDGTGCGQGSRVPLAATAGTEYLIAIGSSSGDSSRAGTVRLRIVAPGAPPNDDFADATVVPAAGGALSGNNFFATEEAPQETSGALEGDNTVWWKWTPTTTGRWVLETCGGGSISPDAEVFRPNGAGLAGLVRLGAEVDECVGPTGERADFVAVAARTYYFRAATSGVEGTIEMTLRSLDRPANDDFADAEALVGQSDFGAGNNVDATQQGGEPEHGNALERSVWWQWTAPTAGTYEVSVDCSTVRSAVRAYTGASLTQLTDAGTQTEKNCGHGNFHGVSLAAAQGQKYFIAVDSAGREAFGLTLQLDGAPPLPDADGDGVPDSSDACPTVSDAAAPRNPRTGCPADAVPTDSDGDGVPNSSDACPTVSDAAAPRNPRTGCPADAVPTDSDGDGLPDSSDACPNKSDAAKPRNPRTGCPADPVGPGDGPTDGDDVLTGDELPNLICGLAGNDTISGLGGNDTLYGDACGEKTGRASVSQVVEDGKDKLFGDDGNDKLYGAGGNDSLTGGKGNDKLFGGAGNDKLKGEAGKDTLNGGAGNDRLTGGPSANKYKAGPGNDRIKAKNKKKETVNCGPGKKDRATVDKKDKVKGCEKVKRAKG